MSHRIPTSRNVPSMLAAAVIGLLAAGAAQAQIKVKNDGQWRALIGAAVSVSSGNTKSTNASLNSEVVRATEGDKIAAYLRALYGDTDDKTTAERVGFGGRYDYNLSQHTYVFGQGDFLRDKPANLQTRLSAATGLGYKLVNTEDTKFDLIGGVGYTRDTFITPAVVAGDLRSNYGRAELLLAEESSHQFTDTAAFKQKLVIYPNLNDRGEFRTVFDAAIKVAINHWMDLTAGFSHRYDSDPGLALKKTDTLFLTGVAVRFE